MENFLWSLKFLTIIPIDGKDKIKPGNSGSVVCWFPVVGFCIGAVASLACLLFHSLFPPIVADALVILVSIAITGAMHLDGLADTCDGVWGGWNRERRLEIMKDSRIGSFGAIGLICVIGLKYVCLLSVKDAHLLHQTPFAAIAPCIFHFAAPSVMQRCIALMVMFVAGRWAQVCAAGLSRYARTESGTGSFILNGTTRKHVVYASFFPVCLFWFLYGLAGFALFAIIIVSTLIWIWYIKKKIGGMTGDTLGATNETAELLFLLSLLVLS